MEEMNKKEFIKWIEKELPDDSTFCLKEEVGYYGDRTVVIFPEEKTSNFLDIFFK